jgi:hypothetical protein
VLGGLDEFLRGNDYSFVVDLLQKADPHEWQACIKEVLLASPCRAVAVLGCSEVERELGVHKIRMDMDEAILLYYSGKYSELQWDTMAKSVNKLMDDKLRKAFGNPIPCVKTINR